MTDNNISKHNYGQLTGYCKCGKDLGDLKPIEIEQHFLNHKRRYDI